MKVKVNTSWGDCYDTAEIVCPFCGHVFHDSWDYGDGEDIGTLECRACDREFHAVRNYAVTYTSYIPADDEDNEEYWKEGEVFEDGITDIDEENWANENGEKPCELVFTEGE